MHCKDRFLTFLMKHRLSKSVWNGYCMEKKTGISHCIALHGIWQTPPKFTVLRINNWYWQKAKTMVATVIIDASWSGLPWWAPLSLLRDWMEPSQSPVVNGFPYCVVIIALHQCMPSMVCPLLILHLWSLRLRHLRRHTMYGSWNPQGYLGQQYLNALLGAPTYSSILSLYVYIYIHVHVFLMAICNGSPPLNALQDFQELLLSLWALTCPFDFLAVVRCASLLAKDVLREAPAGPHFTDGLT